MIDGQGVPAAPHWLSALGLVLNVGQAVALAWIATRSTRIRRSDLSRPRDDDPEDS